MEQSLSVCEGGLSSRDHVARVNLAGLPGLISCGVNMVKNVMTILRDTDYSLAVQLDISQWGVFVDIVQGILAALIHI